MQTIDLDNVLQQLKPERLQIKLDGVEYIVKELTVADACAFDRINVAVASELAATLKTYFEGRVPPVLEAVPAYDTAEGEEPSLAQLDAREVEFNAWWTKAIAVYQAISVCILEKHSLPKKSQRSRSLIEKLAAKG